MKNIITSILLISLMPLQAMHPSLVEKQATYNRWDDKIWVCYNSETNSIVGYLFVPREREATFCTRDLATRTEKWKSFMTEDRSDKIIPGYPTISIIEELEKYMNAFETTLRK